MTEWKLSEKSVEVKREKEVEKNITPLPISSQQPRTTGQQRSVNLTKAEVWRQVEVAEGLTTSRPTQQRRGS